MAKGKVLPDMPIGLTHNGQPIHVFGRHPNVLCVGCSFVPITISSGLFIAPEMLVARDGTFIIVGNTAVLSSLVPGAASASFDMLSNVSSILNKVSYGDASFAINSEAKLLNIMRAYGSDDACFDVVGPPVVTTITILLRPNARQFSVVGGTPVVHSDKNATGSGQLLLKSAGVLGKLGRIEVPSNTLTVASSSELQKYVRFEAPEAFLSIGGVLPDGQLTYVLRSLGAINIMGNRVNGIVKSAMDSDATLTLEAQSAWGNRFAYGYPVEQHLTFKGQADITVDYQCGFIPAGETEVMIDANGEKFLTARSE